MEIEQRLLERAEQLTPAERRIAETVLSAPQVVAFGTVADLATAAGAGAATVVRFATKLGYEGYSDLQASIQQDLVGRLRPAAERIREQTAVEGDALVERHLDVETSNVRSTLGGLDVADVDIVVRRLADERHPVLVLSGSASRGVAMQFVGDLEQLRPNCRMLDGNQADIVRTLALESHSPTVVVLDLRRYERWLLDAVELARDHDATIVAVSDSVLSPLASSADHAFVVEAASAGPFDSHVGTLALLNLLVIDVAAVRRTRATSRLDRLERAWRRADALTGD